jgi:hypothetical protein
VTIATALRLAICAALVGVAFSGGALAGRVAAPLDVPNRPGVVAGAGVGAGHADAAAPSADTAPTSGHHSIEMTPGGLLVSQQGYTLSPLTTVIGGLPDELLQFRILGPDGEPVVRFSEHHQRLLHLVLVSRDLNAYFHLHPWIDATGTWSVNLPALVPGAYHAFTSFVVTDGPALTLSVGLLVPGVATFAPLPPENPVTPVDGYTVTLTGVPIAGAATGLTMTVTRDGLAVTDLTPYLGALGHLVAIRAGDLAYTHVHPVSHNGSAGGPDVPFMLELPSPGDYRLFFDFSHGDAIHTAAFTVNVPANGEAA